MGPTRSPRRCSRSWPGATTPTASRPASPASTAGWGRFWLRRGLELRINWPGRIAVAPTMSGIFFGLVGLRTLGAVLLYVGLALAIFATVQYFRSGIAQLRAAADESGHAASSST